VPIHLTKSIHIDFHCLALVSDPHVDN